MLFGKQVNISRTRFMGYVRASFQELEAIFGPAGPGYDKTDFEWAVKDDRGVIGTVYNWKNGENYTGITGINESLKRIVLYWNVGGNKYEALQLVEDLVEVYRERALQKQ